jgi:hypothetical protein
MNVNFGDSRFLNMKNRDESNISSLSDLWTVENKKNQSGRLPCASLESESLLMLKNQSFKA